ncbi:NUDIX domain-containing protein [Pseudonocardia sp.]|uniref:NUDIX domain-containing protein n=1 Tax=Pseudonocardia sp. TaxID=60912 RepID=UPI002607E69A|nr:NUDIX domain-containing protein [Pseudonocardia sp.]
MNGRLVTTTEAAQKVGVSARSLARWVQEGRVQPTVRTPGGHLRWDVEQLRRQLAEAPVPEAADQPELEPVAAAIVVSELGVLVGRRHDGNPPWTFIAGKIEPGESPADAAVREVKEETGLVVRAAARPIGRRVHPRTGRMMIYLECYPTEGTDVQVGDPEELAEVRWLDLDELDGYLPGMFEPVRTYLGKALGRK